MAHMTTSTHSKEEDSSPRSIDPPGSDREQKRTRAAQPLFEPIALVLLSLATVGTAWCSYEAAVWGAIGQRTMNLSAVSGRGAARDEIKAVQVATVDVLLFSHYIDARFNSNEVLASFYSNRFRAEAGQAFQAWLATRPFEDTNAPLHPFVPSLYKPVLLADAGRLQDESQQLWKRSVEAGRNGRSYVLVTVLLASALFCGGVAAKFDALWMRRSVLALGLAAIVFACQRLVQLPIQL